MWQDHLEALGTEQHTIQPVSIVAKEQHARIIGRRANASDSAWSCNDGFDGHQRVFANNWFSGCDKSLRSGQIPLISNHVEFPDLFVNVLPILKLHRDSNQTFRPLDSETLTGRQT